MMAYTLFAIAILHLIDAVVSRAGGAVVRGALWLAAAMTLQATLGILTLLHEVPIPLALVHQGVAILVLTLAVVQAERLMAGNTALERQRLRVAAG
jgi:cytochrome c oxidase assembly protein subunit 15